MKEAYACGYLAVGVPAWGFPPRRGHSLVSSRYEHASIILTSSLPSARWGDVFGDHAVASEMIDRIVHHVEVLTLEGTSYRIEDTKLTLPRERVKNTAHEATRNVVPIHLPKTDYFSEIVNNVHLSRRVCCTIRAHVRSGSLCRWCGQDGLEFDGSQAAEAVLPATSVICPFDPGEDRDAELFAGGPGLTVQDVLL